MVKRVYIICGSFPKSEQFGLTSQMQRAAVSVPVNIAEGHTRQYSKEFKQFLFISLGSLSELETLAIIAKELEYINDDTLNEIFSHTKEIGRMLNGLSKSIS